MNMVVVSVLNLFSSNGVEVGRDHSVVGVSLNELAVDVVVGASVVVGVAVVPSGAIVVVVDAGPVVPSVLLLGFCLFFCHFLNLFQKSGLTLWKS